MSIFFLENTDVNRSATCIIIHHTVGATLHSGPTNYLYFYNIIIIIINYYSEFHDYVYSELFFVTFSHYCPKSKEILNVYFVFLLYKYVYIHANSSILEMLLRLFYFCTYICSVW